MDSQLDLENHYSVYADRPDLPYVLHKRRYTAPEHLPRFVRVFPDGTQVGRDSKNTAG